MTRKIWKYPLQITDSQTIEVRQVFVPRFVGLDPAGELCIWIEVDDRSRERNMPVYIVGTGHPIPDFATYVGSFVQDAFVWHVYVRM